MDKERFYTVKEVARLMDCSEPRVRWLIRERRLHAIINTKREGYRIASSYLEEFLDRCEKEGGSIWKKPGAKLKNEVTLNPDSLVDFTRPKKKAKPEPVLLYFVSEPRDNGKSTVLIVDSVNRCFVYDRSHDMSQHNRYERIELGNNSLEVINNLADNFESAGFKEFGRGFFDQGD